MGLFDSPEPFKGQDYSTLKKSCLETGQPFEDPEFPTTYSSLFFTPDKVILDFPTIVRRSFLRLSVSHGYNAKGRRIESGLNGRYMRLQKDN